MTTEDLELRVGRYALVLLLIAGIVTTVVLGGPWWVPTVCAVLLTVRIPTLLSLLVIAVLVYLTWGTWWLLAPLAVLGFRVRRIPVGEHGIRELTRYQQTEDPEALKKSVTMLRAALTYSESDKVKHSLYAAYLGDALASSFCRSGEDAVAEEALRICRDGLATLPSDHPERGACLARFGSAFFAVYECSGDAAVLQDAIQVRRDAVSAAADETERSSALTGLGASLIALFEQEGEPAVLDEAVSVNREALAACPPDDTLRPRFQINLAGSLMISYARRGELRILDEVVRLSREAVATSSDNPTRAWCSAGLGGALMMMAQRTGNIEMLEDAAGVFRDALAGCPPDAAERDGHLGNLGAVLWELYNRTGRPDLADEALRLAREAADTAPGPPRAGRLASLSAALLRTFDINGDLAVLAEGIQRSRDALAATTPDHHLERRASLRSLGDALALSFEHSGDLASLAEARQVLAAAGMTAAESVLVRISDLRKAADLDLLAGDHDHAVTMTELAVAQVPQVASRQLGRADREHRVVALAGLASTVAAAAIAAGDPDRAVELLEQTRGILLAGTFDTRDDLAELRNRSPSLARELRELQAALEDADHAPNPLGIPPAGATEYRKLAERRVRLAGQWNELLARIRRLPGLSGFLQPPSINQLRRQATEGPIVYVTAHDQRGHALIVTDDPDRPVHVVELADLTQNAAIEQADRLRLARQTASDPDLPASERAAGQQQILRILGWLWDTVTEPVLRHLDHTAAKSEAAPWPRMWWCPAGNCAFLPLHAAGHHTPPYTETVMDRVISSYTPTIRALSHVRAAPPTTTTAPSIVIVAVPDAPDSSPLPGVPHEAELLRRLIPAATVLRPPSYENVAAAMPNHRIAHFACHGLTDTSVPADSRLLLDDHLVRPLTVNTIARMRLDKAELAYLSACSTTDTARDHADEAIHITAAFQLAGYRHVIGTLWPVNDHAATDIASDFYASLTHNGTSEPDPTTAAETLHHVIRQRRTRYPSLPTQWAAYLHTGL